jgi:hypothetical protein
MEHLYLPRHKLVVFFFAPFANLAVKNLPQSTQGAQRKERPFCPRLQYMNLRRKARTKANGLTSHGLLRLQLLFE